MWQLCSGRKKKTGYKIVYVWSQLYKKLYNIHRGIHEGKAVNGGYFWVVILPVIIFFCFTHFCIFQVFYNDYVLFYNTEKHRLLKHSSDVLIIRMYFDIINMWEQYYCASTSRTFFFRVHFLLVINLHSLFCMCYDTSIRR